MSPKASVLDSPEEARGKNALLKTRAYGQGTIYQIILKKCKIFFQELGKIALPSRQSLKNTVLFEKNPRD
jgi:hypothetical protein